MAGDAPSPAPVGPAARGPDPPVPRAVRRYRPETFAEVIGQEHVTDPLQQALRNNRVNHAYLFSGPRGCGKTTSARILARCLNCEQGPTPDPCGECQSCVALARSGPGTIDVIEIDAASHGGVDDARDLREKAFFGPVSSRYKIYIIDEAHMVTSAGFNALLKVVEEPPEHLKFIFATTEPEKVIGTIRSRTHHYPFRLVRPCCANLWRSPGQRGRQLSPRAARRHPGRGRIRAGLAVHPGPAAGRVRRRRAGLPRAITLLGYTDEKLLDDVTDAFAPGDGAAVFRAVDRVVESGHDPRRFAADLLDRLRDLIILAAVPDAGETGLLDIPADRLGGCAAGRQLRPGPTDPGGRGDHAGLVEMRGATSPRLLLELMCAQVLLPGAGPASGPCWRGWKRWSAGSPAASAPRWPGRPPMAAPAEAGGGQAAGAGAAGASAAGPQTPSPAAAAKAAGGGAGKAAPPRPRGSESPAGTTGRRPRRPRRSSPPRQEPSARPVTRGLAIGWTPACCRAGGPTCSKPSRPSARWPGSCWRRPPWRAWTPGRSL